MRSVGRFRRGAERPEPQPPQPQQPPLDENGNPLPSKWHGPGPRHRGNPLPEGMLPTIAAITMARDEGRMIRKWVDHYAREFGAEHVYVVDDHSSDGSTDDLPCTVLRYPYLRKYGFEPSRMGIVSGLAYSLLFAYDAVLFCDADEFIVADPRAYPSLRHLALKLKDRHAIGVTAYNVVQDVAREAPLDFDRPFLQQRSYAKFTPLMCKPSLKFVRSEWSHASHAVACEFEVEPDLVMFHMKFADRDLLATSAASRHTLNQNEERAKKTSWARSGDEMVELLDEVSAQLHQPSVELVKFRPPQRRLEQIVRREGEPGQPNERWRATGDGQVFALRRRRFSEIPDRFRDLV